MDKEIHKPVGVGGFLEKNHENKAYCKGIGHIRQEINSLEQVTPVSYTHLIAIRSKTFDLIKEILSFDKMSRIK